MEAGSVREGASIGMPGNPVNESKGFDSTPHRGAEGVATPERLVEEQCAMNILIIHFN